MVRGNGVGRRYVWTTGQGWQKDSQNEEGTTYDGQYCSGAESVYVLQEDDASSPQCRKHDRKTVFVSSRAGAGT